MMRKILWIALLLGITACTNATAALPTNTPTQVETTAPTATELVTFTPPPTRTNAPSATASKTASPSPSLSPTPAVDLSQAQVINIIDLVGGISVVVKIPNITTPYNMILAGIKFECHLEEQYPDWLLCWGLSRPPFDIEVTQAFLDQETGELLSDRKVVLSSAVLPTAIPEGYGLTNCPDRGKQVSCETECRLDPDGNPCIVATCTDACGLYRSIHSCPNDMALPSPLCNADQWAQMKAKYGLP